MAKVVSDFVLFDPVFLCVFFTATQLLEGHTVQDGIRKLKVDLLGTYWMDVKGGSYIQNLINIQYGHRYSWSTSGMCQSLFSRSW